MASDEGGWSLSDTESDRSGSSDTEATTPSEDDRSEPGSEEAEETPADDVSSANDEAAKPVLIKVALRELLQTFLDRTVVGSNPPGPLSGYYLNHLATSVCEHQITQKWTSYEKSDLVLIKVPPALATPVFYDTLMAKLEQTDEERHTTKVLVQETIASRIAGQQETVLAALCHQILLGSTFEYYQSDIYDDLRQSLRGLDPVWRQDTLWTLLRTLLVSGPQKHTIELGFSALREESTFSEEAKVLKKLAKFLKATEMPLKVIVAVPAEVNVDLDAAYPLEIRLEQDHFKDALSKDIASWIDHAIESRPGLKRVQDRISMLAHKHYDNPLLVASYLQHTKNRQLVTTKLIDKDEQLLSDLDLLFQSVLDAIPDIHRPLITMIIAIVCHAARPLTVDELATIIAIENSREDLDSMDLNLPLGLSGVLRDYLAAILDINEQSLQLSRPFQYLTEQNDFKEPTLSSKQWPWLGDGPKINMQMAHICVQYISFWKTKNEDGTNTLSAVSPHEWTLLDYAVRFWHVHYQRAVDAEDIGILSLIEQGDFLRTWLHLWPRSHPWETTHSMSSDKIQILNTMSRFNFSISTAIKATLLAKLVLSEMDEDEDAALVWAAWQLDHQNHQNHQNPATWLEQHGEGTKFSSLIKGFPRAPYETFLLLGADDAFLEENASVILSCALERGISSIVDRCLDVITLDKTSVQELPWLSCARYGYTALIKKLISKYPSVVAVRDYRDRNVLHEAVRQGHLDTVDIILESEIDVDATDKDGETVAMLAIRLRYIGILRLLLQHKPKPDLSRQDDRDYTPLFWACEHGYAAVVKLLLENGASLYDKSTSNSTVLLRALQKNQYEVVKLLLEARKSGLSERTKDKPSAEETKGRGSEPDENESETSQEPSKSGESRENQQENEEDIITVGSEYSSGPLQEAIDLGRLDFLKLLLEQFPSPAAVANELILLPRAAGGKNVEIVEYLVGLDGIRIDVRRGSRTALQVAAGVGHTQIAQILLDHGANAATTDYWDDTPLEDAVASGYVDVARILLKHNPDEDRLGICLHSAASRGHEEMAEMLLDAGADKEFVRRSRRPLHTAAFNESLEVLRLLLVRQVELDCRDSNGNTPLALAVTEYGTSLATVKLLLDAGTDVNGVNNASQTPVHLAAAHNNGDIIKLLLDRGATIEPDPTLPGNNFLVQLVKSRSYEAIKIVLEHEKMELKATDLAEGFHAALRNDDIPTVHLLLERGANPDEESARARYGTALQECAEFGNLKMARALLEGEHPVSINAIGGEYQTALIASVYVRKPKTRIGRRNAATRKLPEKRFERRRKMLEYLLDHGANPTIHGGRYGSLLNTATICTSVELMTFIIEKTKLPADTGDNEGRTAAHLASKAYYDAIGKLDLLVRLSGPGILVAKDKHGRLPLHFASAHGKESVLDHLLAKGEKGQINTPDNDGWTALHWACRQWNVAIIERLIEEGANKGLRTKDNWAPRHVAIFHDHEDFLDILDTGDKGDGSEEKDLPDTPRQWHNATCDSCHLVSD